MHDTIVKSVDTVLLYSYLYRCHNVLLYIALKDILMLTRHGI